MSFVFLELNLDLMYLEYFLQSSLSILMETCTIFSNSSQGPIFFTVSKDVDNFLVKSIDYVHGIASSSSYMLTSSSSNKNSS